MTHPPLRPESFVVSHGIDGPPVQGAVSPPLHLSSTYVLNAPDAHPAYDYGRMANPNRDLLADTLARLEGGAGAVITGSGMAAIDLLINRLEAGACVVMPHDCYGGTYALLRQRAARGQIRLHVIDQSDPTKIAALRPQLVLVETPSNPLMRVADIGQICALAQGCGAKVAVDNTFLSPALQRPIAHGADFVVHSTTKFINGHSDVIGGAVIARSPEDAAALREWAKLTGAIGAPFDAWLTLRGLRSLFVRMATQQSNALALARFLSAHPGIGRVHYPGLDSHPQHALAMRQQAGGGAMLSFEVDPAQIDARQLVQRLRVFCLAKSLGGVESLIAHPATMTHAAMAPEDREKAGISDHLLRLSVGLEAVDDLQTDLEQALGHRKG